MEMVSCRLIDVYILLQFVATFLFGLYIYLVYKEKYKQQYKKYDDS